MFHFNESIRALPYLGLIATGLILSTAHGSQSSAATTPIAVQVDWNRTIGISKTTATAMHMVHPISRKGAPMHEKALWGIRDLGAKYVRYLNWNPYPRLSIAALYPPTAGKTSWDFSLIDPEIIPYLEATKGQEPVVSFAAIPDWMFKNDQPVVYPDDPNTAQISIVFKRRELLDPSGEQVARYFARIASWYTQGGFTDENGRYHRSGHRYELPWWDVLNEVDHNFTPQQYTRLSDAIVAAVRQVSPKTKFVGLSLGGGSPEFFEYWLNPQNHRPGTPLDMMAYHFYAFPDADLWKYDPSVPLAMDVWQYTFFHQLNAFTNQVKYIESIRKRLSPTTRVNLSEAGTYAPGDFDTEADDTRIPPAYWNLSAAVFAALYVDMARLGIDIVAQSLLAAGPRMAPGNTMLNWITGKPNARFHVLKLIKDNFGPGDKLVSTLGSADVAAQAFETTQGKKILLINKRARTLDIQVDASGQLRRMDVVDEKSGENPARREILSDKRLRLGPFAVAVLMVE